MAGTQCSPSLLTHQALPAHTPQPSLWQLIRDLTDRHASTLGSYKVTLDVGMGSGVEN